eukprot:scaffold8667_cov112-Isochrysis_galbana.AAC.1
MGGSGCVCIPSDEFDSAILRVLVDSGRLWKFPGFVEVSWKFRGSFEGIRMVIGVVIGMVTHMVIRKGC